MTTAEFEIWYGLFQIEQEAESWLREHGLDDEITVGFIMEKARYCRELYEKER